MIAYLKFKKFLVFLNLLFNHFTIIEGALTHLLNTESLNQILTCVTNTPIVSEPSKYMPTDKWLESFGYGAKKYKITTKDNYIITVFRIMSSPKNPPPPRKDGSRPAVLMNHGLGGTSNQWFIQRENNSLALLLADSGYDVWLNNHRGNSYSNESAVHMEYEEYWDFSFHEMSTIDLPAVVNKMLEVTGEKRIYYVGYSMGTTQYLVALSEVPELNDKIATGFLLAVCGRLDHTTNILSNVFRATALAYNKTYLTHSTFGGKISTNAMLREFLYVEGTGDLCSTSVTNCGTCSIAIFALFGFDTIGTNYSCLPSFLSNYADVLATKGMVHFFQLHDQTRFGQFDYGREGNVEKYGKETPPDYNMKNIKSPTIFFVGPDDDLCTAVDAAATAKHMRPGVVKEYHLIDPENRYSRFNHLNFIIGKNLYEFMFKRILYIMDNQLYD